MTTTERYNMYVTELREAFPTAVLPTLAQFCDTWHMQVGAWKSALIDRVINSLGFEHPETIQFVKLIEVADDSSIEQDYFTEWADEIVMRPIGDEYELEEALLKGGNPAAYWMHECKWVGEEAGYKMYRKQEALALDTSDVAPTVQQIIKDSNDDLDFGVEYKPWEITPNIFPEGYDPVSE